MLGFNANSGAPLADVDNTILDLITARFDYLDSLLPSNHTKLERDIELSHARLGEIDQPIRDLKNPNECPSKILPWLAWELSADEWHSDWSDEKKRESIAKSLIIHARKGTVGSIREAIRTAGYGEAVIEEGEVGTRYNGSFNFDSEKVYNSSGHWADYRVHMINPISNEQAKQLRRILENTAPARCKLVELNFTEAAFLYNDVINYDGSFNYGSA